MKARAPNFIVFMTDQQRADHLGCYGNRMVRTPHIDHLAAQGVRFENFFVSCPICQPNRAALATGQMISVNGCRQNGIPLGLDSTTYADVLRGHGYRTGLVGKAHFQNVSNIPARERKPRGCGVVPAGDQTLARRNQRDTADYSQEVRGSWAADPKRELKLPYYGFDHVRLCVGHGDQVEGHYTQWLLDRLNGAADPRGREQALAEENELAPQIWRTAVPVDLYPTSYVGEEACAFLKDTDEQPFLLVVSFPDPHHPFTPPGHYFDMYDPAEMKLPPNFEHSIRSRTDLPATVRKSYETGDKNPDAYWPFHGDADLIRRMIALNYGTITMIDDWVGRIMETLASNGKQQDTVICFMSDHGDYMGDYGTVLKHGVHSLGLIRVPFIWLDPQDDRTGINNTYASAIDFAPTLLQRAGIQVPIGMQGQDVLAPDARDLPVLIEDPGMEVYSDPEADSSIRTLIHQGWRMSVFEGSQLGELYNLQEDPFELTNLWAHPEAQTRKAEFFELMVHRQIALRDKSLLATNQA